MRRRKRHARDAPFVEYRAACGRGIGMCGQRSVPTDVLVVILMRNINCNLNGVLTQIITLTQMTCFSATAAELFIHSLAIVNKIKLTMHVARSLCSN